MNANHTDMHADFARALIAAHGGNTKFRKKLGIAHEPGSKTRVDNWQKRGIPLPVQLLKRRKLASLVRSARARGAVL